MTVYFCYMYVWLPDVELDHARAKELLKRYICDPQHKLALIPGTPDKDEYGHFIVDGFDPLEVALGGVIPKRVRNRPNVFVGGASDDNKSKPPTKGKAAKRKQQPKKKPQNRTTPQKKSTLKKCKDPSKKTVNVSFVIWFFCSSNYYVAY